MKLKLRDYLLLRLGGKIRVSRYCWVWVGALSKNGYGVFNASKKNSDLAHRYLYTLIFGKMSQKLVIRHLCGNKKCVRPEHLKVGTRKENAQDEVDNGRHYWAKRKACKHGHKFEEGSFYLRGNARICKCCARIKSRKHRAEKRIHG